MLVHDLGKVLLLTGEDPANVVCMNTPDRRTDDRASGLDQCTFQWNHDEFGWSRFRDHVPDHVAWLIRYHSIDPDACRAADGRARPRVPDALPRRVLPLRPRHEVAVPPAAASASIDYRDVVEDAFPEPIPF